MGIYVPHVRTHRRWTNLNTLTTDPMHPMHRMHSLVVGASRGLGLALTRHLAEVAHRAGGSGGSQGRVLAAGRRRGGRCRPWRKCGGDSSCLVNGVLFDDGFTILYRY